MCKVVNVVASFMHQVVTGWSNNFLRLDLSTAQESCDPWDMGNGIFAAFYPPSPGFMVSRGRGLSPPNHFPHGASAPELFLNPPGYKPIIPHASINEFKSCKTQKIKIGTHFPHVFFACFIVSLLINCHVPTPLAIYRKMRKLVSMNSNPVKPKTKNPCAFAHVLYKYVAMDDLQYL